MNANNKESKLFNLHSPNIFMSAICFFMLYIISTIGYGLAYSITNNINTLYISKYIILIVLILIKDHKYIINSMKNIKEDSKKDIKQIVFLTILLLILEFISNYIIIKIVGHNPNNNDILIKSLNKSNKIIMIFNLLVTGPIGESLLYIYPYGDVKNRKMAYITYSIFFAISHITSANNLLDLLFIIPYMLMSFAFGYSFYKTNNIFMSIIVHSLNNLIALMLLFIM